MEEFATASLQSLEKLLLQQVEDTFNQHLEAMQDDAGKVPLGEWPAKVEIINDAPVAADSSVSGLEDTDISSCTHAEVTTVGAQNSGRVYGQ